MKRDACVFGVTHPSCCGLAKRDDRQNVQDKVHKDKDKAANKATHSWP